MSKIFQNAIDKCSKRIYTTEKDAQNEQEGEEMYPNIEAERVRAGMSREQFASKLGVSLKTYYNWMKGITAIPSTALIKMSSMFAVEIGYLLKEVTSEPDEKGA